MQQLRDNNSGRRVARLPTGHQRHKRPGCATPNTRSRVQQALDAGHEVTIHERPITESGWKGAGYTLIDPTTGAGAYLIDGGSNGGAFRSNTRSRILLRRNLIYIPHPLVAGGGLAIFWFIFATIVIADILATIYVLTNINDQEVKNCYLGGLVMGLGLGGLFNIAAWIERIMSAIGLWIGGATDATTNQTACGV